MVVGSGSSVGVDGVVGDGGLVYVGGDLYSCVVAGSVGVDGVVLDDVSLE